MDFKGDNFPNFNVYIGGGSIENVNVCKLDMGKKEANFSQRKL